MSEEQTGAKSSTVDVKRVKERSPSYPAISLRRALELVQRFWDADKRQAVMPTRAAQNLGFTAKSSAGGLALAAMKKYGLLDDEGSGEARRIKLTDTAFNILNPSNPNRKVLIKSVALKPPIYALLWNKYGVDGASEGAIQDYLVWERKFLPEAAKTLIASYNDTVKFAELSPEDKAPGLEHVDDEEDGEDLPLFTSGTTTPEVQAPPTRNSSDAAVPLSHKAAGPALSSGVKYFTIPTDIGDAHIPMGMSEEDFELFGAALKLFKSKIVKASRFPIGAIWHNSDHDKPVTIISEMGVRDGVKYYETQGGTGVPEHELTFA